MKSSEYLRRYHFAIDSGRDSVLKSRHKWVVKSIGKGKRVLDLGCSSGHLAQLIKDQNNEVFGVEINAVAARQARARGIIVKEHDLNEGIPFGDRYFDCINGEEILEYIYDTKHLLQECHRVLKPRGFMVLCVRNLNSLENRLRILSGGYFSFQGAYPDDHHGDQIRMFNLSKLQELCEMVGFEVTEVSGSSLKRDRSLWLKTLKPMTHLNPRLAPVLMVRLRRIEVI